MNNRKQGLIDKLQAAGYFISPAERHTIVTLFDNVTFCKLINTIQVLADEAGDLLKNQNVTTEQGRATFIMQQSRYFALSQIVDDVLELATADYETKETIDAN